MGTTLVADEADIELDEQELPPPPPPKFVINPEVLRAQLGTTLMGLFKTYTSERQLAEQKWLRNLRQYLGIYDPEIEAILKASKRSMAYPRITRVKCISVLSRVMNLMFPGNEKNWQLSASPSAEMDPNDVLDALEKHVKELEAHGIQAEITDELVREATQQLAAERAKLLSNLIDDQLTEIGGDQTLDFVSINRSVLFSGILYGTGSVRGPFVRRVQKTGWVLGDNGKPQTTTKDIYKPQYDFLPVWDYYPDMSAKSLASGNGYFVRLVMSRTQIQQLKKRKDFLASQITTYLANNANGNFVAQNFETELRTMGFKLNTSDKRSDSPKFEVVIWHGPVAASKLQLAGVDVSDAEPDDEVEAEVWMLNDTIIRAVQNPWTSLGVPMRQVHSFIFDEDDTSPLGNGLPAIMRDTQMSICAATRMLLDNASVVCGPNLEVNEALLMPGQDTSGIAAYKVWRRDSDGPDASLPAVKNIQIDGHLPELQAIIDLFMTIADIETFVGPATGGDMGKGPSEPMRTAVGQSMTRGDAALPFKDIVRNHDKFTQSVILACVLFNRQFNPDLAPEGDFNVIARGATSLIAKEIRGLQVDTLAGTLSPEERMHIDERKLIEARLSARDMNDLLVPMTVVRQRQQAAQTSMAEEREQTRKMAEAEIRKTLSDAVKNIAQAQKNSAGADKTQIEGALALLEAAMLQATDGEGDAAPAKPKLAIAKGGKA